jgi:hypothetical protein
MHLESVPVEKQVDGHTIWSGSIEIFELINHGAAKRCYAWLEIPGKAQHHFVAVLQKGLVISPESAVKAWLASKSVTIHPV